MKNCKKDFVVFVILVEFVVVAIIVSLMTNLVLASFTLASVEKYVF